MKKAVERSLGLRPTREELIKDYFHTRQTRDAWRQDVSDVQCILQNLYDLYVMSKDECFVCRYTTLKHMVTATLADYNRFCELREVRLNNERRTHGGSGERSSGEASPHSASGSISRLKANAVAIANIQKEVGDWRELNAEVESQSTKELTRQSEKVREEVLRLEWEYVTARNKLEQLADRQELAETLCCCSRYGAYKHMVKAAFVDALIAATGPHVARI